MEKEKQFYIDRSGLLGKLIDFIKLCVEVDRDYEEEVDEIIEEAKRNIE